MDITFEPEVTCCFAGYRPHKYGFELLGNDPNYLDLVQNLTNAIRNSYADGYRYFLCGGAIGFDLLAAETTINLREELPGIKIICVLPFENQAKRFTKAWLDKYKNALKNCDHITYVSHKYTDRCYYERTEKMLESSSRMIVYFDGKDGGTARSVALAQGMKLDIINLCKEKPVPRDVGFFTGSRRY